MIVKSVIKYKLREEGKMKYLLSTEKPPIIRRLFALLDIPKGRRPQAWQKGNISNGSSLTGS